MDVFKCDACSLRVRITNRAAYTLYSEILGYTTRDIEKSYYADGEDAYDMQLKFHYGPKGNIEEKKVGEETTPEQNSSNNDQYAESNQNKKAVKEAVEPST